MHRPLVPSLWSTSTHSAFGLTQPSLDKAAAGGGGAGEPLGEMPSWDFSGLYAEPAEAKIDADIDETGRAINAFAEQYEGKLASLSGAEMLAAIEAYEKINDTLGRVMSYVGLRYQQNSADPGRGKALGDAQGKVTDITAPLVFFELELLKIDDESLDDRR